MAIKMVRRPSEEPNINNVDDFIGLRYAYGNQNGYVISRGSEISYTISGQNFVINSGRIVVCGVEVEIDANGHTITVDNISTKRYYIAYLKINLATNNVEIESIYDTAGFTVIDSGDDLTQNTSGIAYLGLYRFSATNGAIGEVEKIIQPLAYTGTALKDYDISKGTVEERLTRLGFREGVVSANTDYYTSWTDNNNRTVYFTVKINGATPNNLKRQGNFVIANFEIELVSSSPLLYANAGAGIIGYLPKGFWPKEELHPYVSYGRWVRNSSSSSILPFTIKSYYNNTIITIRTNGEIVLNGGNLGEGFDPAVNGPALTLSDFRDYGYEAAPLEPEEE